MSSSQTEYSHKQTVPHTPHRTRHTHKPFGLFWRSHTLFIVSTVIIGLFSETFLYGIAVPILPFLLEDRIGINHDELQTYSSVLLAVYSASSIAISPIAGVIADKTASRKLPFMFGLVLLIIVTPLFFATHSLAVLIITRCIQGAGCAFVWTVGFALCLDAVGSENMGKTLGTVLSFVGIGGLIAPPLGGLVYSESGVLAVALLATGVLLIDLVMRSLLIEKKVASQHYPVVVSSVEKAERPFIDAAIELQGEPAQTEEESSEHDFGEDLPFTKEKLGLISNEDSSRDYLIEPTSNRLLRTVPLLSCFRTPSLMVALFLNATQAILLGAFDATLPLEANDLYQFESFTSGLLFMPMAVLRLACGPIGGWAVDRFGTKIVAVSGYTFLIPILILFRLVGSTPQITSIVLYCVLLALSGVGLAVVGTPGFVEAATLVKKYHDRNLALFGANGPFASLYGMNLMVFSFGMTVGPMMAGFLREKFGYGNMNGALAFLCGCSAIISFFWLGGDPVMPKRMKNGSRG